MQATPYSFAAALCDMLPDVTAKIAAVSLVDSVAAGDEMADQ